MAASINIHGIGGQPAGRTRGATTVTGNWEHLQGLLLADPDFLKPGPIDVIIGADAYGLLVESEVVKGRAIDPIAQRTLLGWIVLGPVNGSTSNSVRIQHASIKDEVTSLLAKFWEQEEIPPDSAPTTDPDESACEQHFKDTHTRDHTGRYIVRLPFKNPSSLFGDSYSGAKRCLLQLLRRLLKNESYHGLYNAFLQEYKNLSHMARAPTATSSSPRFFLPHHGVFRAHSATTKLRVVFNGVFRTSNGVSINDILHTGAKLQRLQENGYASPFASFDCRATWILGRLPTRHVSRDPPPNNFSRRGYNGHPRLLEDESSPPQTTHNSTARVIGGSTSFKAGLSRSENPRLNASTSLSLWTDPSVALTWITSNSARWKYFIRIRVTSIQNFSSQATWRFIAGKENPADCASRGQTPRQLSKHHLWWHGPEWLPRPPSSWPVSSAELPPDGDLEQRSGLAFTTISENSPINWDLLQRYSSLTRLLRITAVCQRAVARFKRLPHASITYPLNTGDLEEARFFWIRLVQRTHFSAELQIISSGATLNRGHSLAALNPFVDQLGTLRVGGRLTNTLLQPEAKHPPILPRTSPLTSLIIADSHFRTLHGGTQSTLSFLRRSYWIPGGRAPIRSYILRCTTCARFRGLQAQQLMGHLPTARVTPSRAFLHTGIDYAGPFTVKTWRGRETKTYKAYLAVFVCFTTSAVHLELVTDYTSEAFVAAYRRFSGRRGLSHTIYSDCGTNFIGADTALRALFKAGSAEMNSTIISLTNLGTN